MAAPRTFSVPTTLASRIAGCWDSGMPTSYIAAAWMTASQPAMPGAQRLAVAEVAGDESRQPSSVSLAAFSGLRTRQTHVVAAVAQLARDRARR